MSTMLYLDTARLGQMSPTALKTHCDFVRLMAEDPSSLYTEQFLFDGATSTPDIARRFPELARWRGIEGLKQQLRHAFAANTDSSTDVLLASRTTSLMQLSIRSLLNNGRRHLLLTDLTWPPYRKWIQRFANRNEIKLSMLPLRESIWQHGFPADDVATVILDHMRRTQADSLFLPAVTHTGICLPLPIILKSTSNVHTIIDASQAYGHINTSDWSHLAGFTFGGCHKWVRAYLPLGVAFARKPEVSRSYRPRRCDPLSQFCAPKEDRAGLMETVNLTPLLTASGAMADLSPTAAQNGPAASLQLLQPQHSMSPWQVLRSHESLASNITMIQLAKRHLQSQARLALRERLAKEGVTATAYKGGVIRISLPPNQHTNEVRSALLAALTRLSTATEGQRGKVMRAPA